MPLFILFIVIPLIELMLLIEVGSIIGTFTTILIILVTALIGTTLVKQQGFQTWQTIQLELAQGQIPAKSLVAAICILIAGVLLITPGFLTDTIGLLLLVPATREWIFARASRHIKVTSAYRQTHNQSYSSQTNDENLSATTIEGEFERKE